MRTSGAFGGRKTPRRIPNLSRMVLLLFLAAFLACGKPAALPDPPVLAQRMGLWPVREIQVVHQGCFGQCPTYKVKLYDDGKWEWEGIRFVSQVGQIRGKTFASDFFPLFDWLTNHPVLYTASADKIRCEDCEVVEFTFGVRSGKAVVVKYGMGFDGDDYWVLANIVDALIAREKSR